jgi:hypothetical protein
MNQRAIHPLRIATILVLVGAAAVLFCTGINWGLPTRSTDAYLFGDHSVWTGSQILQLTGSNPEDDSKAADVSSEPVVNRSQSVVLNATDAQRARIVRRYRLMSHQPDEFTTFAALSRMKPSHRDLDPRMYKYGGLWIYPVGALLKVASLFRIVQLRPDLTFYLDHPESFARFYCLARLYSVMWGLLGVVIVYLVVGRISGNDAAGFAAGLCFALMPVVINAAHEAKPHLAGTVLMLMAVLAAARYAEGGGRRFAFLAAIGCGAAIGMVPSAAPVLLVLPGMILVRRRLVGKDQEGDQRFFAPMAAWMLIALTVYCVTNPFIPINLIRNRSVLISNFSNSSDFYRLGLAGIRNALLLVMFGMSGLLTAAGAVGAVALAIRARRVTVDNDAELKRRSTGLMLAAPALAIGMIFMAFAASQPADYARFALPFDVFLLIEGVVGVSTFIRVPRLQRLCFGMLVLATGFSGLPYVRGFLRDASTNTTRSAAAGQIQRLLESGHGVLVTREEPAPWSLPPVDLFRWRIVLPPRNAPFDFSTGHAGVAVAPADFASSDPTPISWASKPFEIRSSP